MIATTNTAFNHPGGKMYVRATAACSIELQDDANPATWSAWVSIASGTESKAYDLPKGTYRLVFASGAAEVRW
ncbi:MAG: hypothetical protein II007_13430 [Gammaproteobacteria bacterium]|nr:hypothetical protein [Gammaproteobacteria bacterium]